MLTEPEYVKAIDYCFRRSWRVRLMPRASRALIRECLELLHRIEEANAAVSDDTAFQAEVHSRRWLVAKMEHKARAASRNVWRPVKATWLLILLQVVLPAIIRLVLKWWLNRKRSEA